MQRFAVESIHSYDPFPVLPNNPNLQRPYLTEYKNFLHLYISYSVASRSACRSRRINILGYAYFCLEGRRDVGEMYIIHAYVRGEGSLGVIENQPVFLMEKPFSFFHSL